MKILFLSAFISVWVLGCENSKLLDQKVSSSSNDAADHKCQIVLRSASFSKAPPVGYYFSVAVNKAADRGPLGIWYRDNSNSWKEARGFEFNGNDERYNYYNYKLSVYPNNSMYLHVVAFAERDGGKLFDHNFESGDFGYISLERSNNWTALGLSKHCF